MSNVHRDPGKFASFCGLTSFSFVYECFEFYREDLFRVSHVSSQQGQFANSHVLLLVGCRKTPAIPRADFSGANTRRKRVAYASRHAESKGLRRAVLVHTSSSSSY